MSIKNIIFDGFQIIVAAVVTISITASLIFVYRSSGDSIGNIEVLNSKKRMTTQQTVPSALVHSEETLTQMNNISIKTSATNKFFHQSGGEIETKKVIITFKKHTTMSSGGTEDLKDIFFLLKSDNNLQVKIIGYSDAATGGEDINLKISLKRAEVVKSYLVSLGVNANRIKTTGEGGANPIARNDTLEGRKINRRVEIIIY